MADELDYEAALEAALAPPPDDTTEPHCSRLACPGPPKTRCTVCPGLYCDQHPADYDNGATCCCGTKVVAYRKPRKAAQ